MKLTPWPCACATISRATAASVWSANIIVPRHSVDTLSGLLPRRRYCMASLRSRGLRRSMPGGSDRRSQWDMPRLPAPPLELYRSKRDFAVTPEPSGDGAASRDGGRAYVIQKHAATRLHYDLRLEHGGVMWSWAVPKGPSYDPSDKRIAMRTEDHPIAYNRFEGTIPKGHYGAGTVLVWDRGRWEPAGDPAQGLADGKLLFTLHGQKLKGQWELVRIKPKDGERGDPWILFKKRDAHARARQDYDVVRALPDSVGPEPETVPAPAAPRNKAKLRKAAGLPLPDAAVPAEIPATLSPQ